MTEDEIAKKQYMMKLYNEVNIQKNKNRIEHLEEWEHELNKSVEWFNKHNHYPTEINEQLSFTDCYSSNRSDDYYDLKLQFKSLDDNQLEKICDFIKCL